MQLHKILGDIRKADQDYNLIQDNDTIAVGVSGGKDSMVLLTALHMYSKFPDKHFKVIGIHIKMGFPLIWTLQKLKISVKMKELNYI